MPEIPKKIWAAWFQGWDAAPDLVRMILTRWAVLNPDWEVEVLDHADAEALLADTDVHLPSLTPMALSDVVRVKLLGEQGGVWVDATLYPCWPLDAWLPIVAGEGFFMFKNSYDPNAVPNWFLASEPGHPMATAWRDDTERFWSRPRDVLSFGEPWPAGEPFVFASPDSDAPLASYLWTMELFNHRLQNDPEFAAARERIPHLEEDAIWVMSHLLTRPERCSLADLEDVLTNTPVQKLGWRGNGWPVATLATLGL